MSVRTFIPKDDQRLPDYYGLKVHYLDGRTDEFELAGHNIQDVQGTTMLYLATKDDLWNWIPVASIKRLEWSKEWSKILALKESPSEPKT